ncbi:DUF4150 domain-containing protein [Myxococcus stipitatus]|uniref:DUF4150 domain-containing protein n=1 Tax=Myxococcus stipitatus TaxID=83455 RepID=UPI00314507AC
MGKKVFANGMEVAHQAGDAKVMAAFPDVCLSPPPPPAGPVPIPYPNTSFAKDLKKGSSSVTVGGKPVALKGKSYYQTSPLGDEAATRNFGGSALTHTITGKTYFQAHSMDVVMEGKNVCRHLDLTTSNHASYPGSTPPLPNMEAMVQLALDRIAENKCPCCGSETCPAAFKEGDEAQSFDDFYKLNEPHPSNKAKFKGKLSDRGEKRSREFAAVRAQKAAQCTCAPGNRVFPEPPCDVFRAHDSERTKKIIAAWDEERSNYRDHWESVSGRQLLTPESAMARLREQAGGSFASDAEAKAALTQANKQSRINHLVPKEAGGCPTNPGNLQPQSELCAHCQGIDDLFTSKWQ